MLTSVNGSDFNGQGSLWSLAPTRCKVCGRPLKNPLSIHYAIGPICRGHSGKEVSETKSGREFSDFADFTPLSEGIVLRRDEAGNVWTNIPHLVTHHSPDGFEFGYGGSGPADLALNVCEVMLNRLDHHGERNECWRGECWDYAWLLHQDFKWRFISPAPREGITIPYAEVETWFIRKLAELSALAAKDIQDLIP